MTEEISMTKRQLLEQIRDLTLDNADEIARLHRRLGEFEERLDAVIRLAQMDGLTAAKEATKDTSPDPQPIEEQMYDLVSKLATGLNKANKIIAGYYNTGPK